MKKVSFTFLFFIFISITSIAATGLVECEGYFIRKGSRDTVHSIVVVPINASKKIIFEKLQWKITLKDKFSFIDFEKEPEEIKEFGFVYSGRKYVYWSVPNPFDVSGPKYSKEYKYIFLRLRRPGFCKIFSGFTYEKGLPPMEGKANEDLILKANNKEWMVVREFEFLKDMNFYFSDYPELLEKINNKTYLEKDLEKIVSEYNLFKAQKK